MATPSSLRSPFCLFGIAAAGERRTCGGMRANASDWRQPSAKQAKCRLVGMGSAIGGEGRSMSGPILGRRILAVLFEQLASMPSLIAVPNATIASAAAQATQQTTLGPKAVSWKAENAAFSIKIGDSYDSAIAVHCRLGAPRWRVSDALMPRRNDRGSHSLHLGIAALYQRTLRWH